MKRVTIIALTFMVGAFFSQCQTQTQVDEVEEKSPNKRLVIYQMMTRLFGNTNTTNKLWGTIEENGVGKLNDISNLALKTLALQGYTHVWYTGILEHATLTDYTAFGIPLDDADVVKGRAGSPYAIKDYYDINPDLAISVPDRMNEFESLVKRTHQADLKVIIDFVPNHVARAYHSDAKPTGTVDLGADDNPDLGFDTNNNFYYLSNSSFTVPEGYNPLGNTQLSNENGQYTETPARVSGNDVFSASPSINDWFETIKLNYGMDYQNNRKTYFDPIPDTWIKMRDILLFWSAKGVDGFRCDMAEMVPVEFWQWVTQELKATYPEMIFIAEIYNPNAYRQYLDTGGFDYLYDKVELYDTLKHIIQGKATTDDLTAIWKSQEGITDKMLRFLENHDEQRIASTDFAGDMRKGIPMMAASAFMNKGPVMMYFGQDVGEPGNGESGFAGEDGRTTIFDYWGVPEHVKWINNGKFNGGKLSAEQKQLQKRYVVILQACNQSDPLREGDFYDLHYYNRNGEFQGYSHQVYAFIRHTPSSAVLVLINFGLSDEKANIKIPEDAWKASNITSDNIEIGDQKISRLNMKNYAADSDLVITIPALDYLILPISKQ